jgi:sensor c-di-GMP phosphodiesterase-like protein
VKVRQRYRSGRAWFAVAFVVLGLLAGYLIGRESILHSTGNRLGEYADLLLQRDEDLGAEVDTTLSQANASTDPPCSDADIALLRRLTFTARFLKDVGRLHDYTLLCSATSGKLATPLLLLKPDFQGPSGSGIYRSYPLQIPVGGHAMVVALDRANVVVSTDVFSEFPQQPLRYSVGIVDPAKSDRAHQVIVSRISGEVSIPSVLVESRRALRIGSTLYRAHCSSRYPLCVMTNVPLQEVWSTNRALLSGYIATGGAAGVSCAVALLLSGRKKRSHTHQLKRAILMGKLSVAYQPIVELGSHRIVGAEALARWTDEDGESIRPETIIALAEAEGFVSEITRFVLTRSLDELGPILEHRPDFRLGINLAPSDLADPRLLLLLDERLHHSLISPANLAFELTERATSDREIAVAAIRRLRERGHSVFIDDFGTGYSNLAYLTELNVDGIKINRSFIATLGTESVTASIVPQILAVAKTFGLSVVVQGIEREEQAKYFAAADPHMLGQGWFFGLPVPARSLLYLCAERSE